MDLPVIFKDKKTGEVSSVETLSDPRNAYIQRYNEQSVDESLKSFAEMPNNIPNIKITAQPVSDRMFWLLLVGVGFFGIQALTQFSQFIWGLINLFTS